MTEGFWNESIVRSAVKIMLENRSLGPAMVNVNPVVDPSAPLVDPSNTDFVPTNSTELKAALSAMVTGVPDDNVPEIYDSIKNALESTQEDTDMRDEDRKVEEAIRRAVRKLIKEALPVPPPPKFFPPAMPSKAPGEDPETQEKIKSLLSKSDKQMSPAARIDDLAKFFRSKDKKLAVRASLDKASKIFHAATREPDNAAAASKFANPKFKPERGPDQQAPEQRGMIQSKDLGHSYSGDVGGSDEQDIKKPGKKNLMTADEGGIGLKELAKEFGFANPNGVLQWINKILNNKVYPRMVMYDSVLPLVLETIKEWIEKHDNPEDQFARRWEIYSQPGFEKELGKLAEVITDNDDYRKMLQPKMKRLDKLLDTEQLMAMARTRGLR